LIASVLEKHRLLTLTSRRAARHPDPLQNEVSDLGPSHSAQPGFRIGERRWLGWLGWLAQHAGLPRDASVPTGTGVQDAGRTAVSVQATQLCRHGPERRLSVSETSCMHGRSDPTSPRHMCIHVVRQVGRSAFGRSCRSCRKDLAVCRRGGRREHDLQLKVDRQRG
jgi:hypothetical protein